MELEAAIHACGAIVLDEQATFLPNSASLKRI
jgi:hypothetical protein